MKLIAFLIELVFAHFLGDYFLQAIFQKVLGFFGIKYTKFGNWQIWVHCGTYLIFFIPVFWIFGANWLWLIFLFLSHLIIDTQVEKIKVKRSYRDLSYVKRLVKLDVGLIVDQGLHFLCLLVTDVFSIAM